MKFSHACTIGLILAAAPVWAAKTLSSERDQLSYTVGYSTGQAMVASKLDIASKAFERGIGDALAQRKASLSDEKMREVMGHFQQQRIAQQLKQRAQLAKQNQEEGQTFLAANAKHADVKVLASGLQYKVLEQGHGSKPKLSDSVTVDYEGRFLSQEVFDSSYQREEVATLDLGAVIKGWQEALLLMSEGDAWELYVPAELAYGEQGAGPIGPNQTLVFKIHLHTINAEPLHAEGQQQDEAVQA